MAAYYFSGPLCQIFFQLLYLGMTFLSGRQVPEGISRGSMRWLADELLTVMRLQDPPWGSLADELGKAAFQPGTDPVVRDYLMQHLGHLWEQHGAREEIERTLWQAVATSDETTAGTALVALSRDFEWDGETEHLAKPAKKPRRES